MGYNVEVLEHGREMQVPFPPGVHLTVFVVENSVEVFDDLVVAAQSSLDFWDHPFDDEDWNNTIFLFGDEGMARRYQFSPRATISKNPFEKAFQ